ncbi:MAG: hypothetical protein L7U72_03295, partial [Rubripirellula sp.]|nr:hypothetical protein [Rubripirellula sp.]
MKQLCMNLAFWTFSLTLSITLAPQTVIQAQESRPAYHASIQKRENQSARSHQAGVPMGSLRKGVFENSKVFPGTTREYSVYVPDQYTDDQPANLMVFMDGSGYSNP